MVLIISEYVLLIKAEWDLYASVDNGLSPAQCQAVIGIIASILSLWNKLLWNLNQNKIFIQEKYIWKYRLQNGHQSVSALMCWNSISICSRFGQHNNSTCIPKH